ncbi:MAG: hypothetical protein EOO68_01370, partial [Moraxellaceae bacterium]
MNIFGKAKWRCLLLAALTTLALTACGNKGESAKHTDHADHHEAAEPVVEKGSHNGRLLKDGAFTLE